MKHKICKFPSLFFLVVFLWFIKINAFDNNYADELLILGSVESQQSSTIHKKINFVSAGNRKAKNPSGWEEYDGSIYNKERGYGWLTNLYGSGRDRGANATIELIDGQKVTPQDLNRLELANWQGTHQENIPLIFRVDLPDGWYRVTCTSVDPGASPLPLVDQRSFKCRAHDVVFAGASYGVPLTVSGDKLVEGKGLVEVADGHLRIVVGDPAYAGWTWMYRGSWYKGWKQWWGKGHQYASGWYQKFARTVDPGFHSLRLNSLEIERVPAPKERCTIIFRDYFNRDNSQDINSGVATDDRWVRVRLNPDIPDHIRLELYQTSIKLTGLTNGKNGVSLLQQRLSPVNGIIRYSTRISLFMGEGSLKHSGSQEAGIILLADQSEPTEYNSTFVGVSFDSSRSDTMGWLIYRVGDGKDGYRTNLEVPDTVLPFKITEGEFEIIVDHDVGNNCLSQIKVNEVDVTDQLPLQVLRQRKQRGLFGIRSIINNTNPKVNLQQFYWSYRVENLN